LTCRKGGNCQQQNEQEYGSFHRDTRLHGATAIRLPGTD
jgi:hypothetical protein